MGHYIGIPNQSCIRLQICAVLTADAVATGDVYVLVPTQLMSRFAEMISTVTQHNNSRARHGDGITYDLSFCATYTALLSSTVGQDLVEVTRISADA